MLKPDDCLVSTLCDHPINLQLHECVGSALGALGPDAFLCLLPLNLDAEDISDANVWLLPILKRYMVGARLSFFTKKILKIVSRIQQKSIKVPIFSSNKLMSVFYVTPIIMKFCYATASKGGTNLFG